MFGSVGGAHGDKEQADHVGDLGFGTPEQALVMMDRELLHWARSRRDHPRVTLIFRGSQ